MSDYERGWNAAIEAAAKVVDEHSSTYATSSPRFACMAAADIVRALAKPESRPALESCSECGEAYRHALSCSHGANAVVRQPESQPRSLKAGPGGPKAGGGHDANASPAASAGSTPAPAPYACARCGHGVLAHFVDDEERRACTAPHCACLQYVTPAAPLDLGVKERLVGP